MGKILKKVADYLEEKFPNHLILGDKALTAKNYEKAISHYEELESKGKLNEYTFFNWGVALGGLKNYEEAILKFKKSIELNNEFYDSYIQWGLTLYKMELFKQADDVYKELCDKVPDFAAIYFHWALNKEALNQMDEALKLYEKAIELTPNDVLSINAIAKIHFMREDYNIAMKYFGDAVKINNKFAPAYLNMAVIHNRKGETKEALDLLKKSIQLDPTAKLLAVNSGEFDNIKDTDAFQDVIDT